MKERGIKTTTAPLDGLCFCSFTSPPLVLRFPRASLPPRCCSSRLGEDSGDEIVKPLGVLLWVHCGDLCSGLDIKHARLIHPLFDVCVCVGCHGNPSTYPVFDSLGGVGSFLLGIVMLKDIYDSHEINLLPGSSWRFKQTP